MMPRCARGFIESTTKFEKLCTQNIEFFFTTRKAPTSVNREAQNSVGCTCKSNGKITHVHCKKDRAADARSVHGLCKVGAGKSACGLGGLPLQAWSGAGRAAAFDVYKNPLPLPSQCSLPSNLFSFFTSIFLTHPLCITRYSLHPSRPHQAPLDSPPAASKSASPLPVHSDPPLNPRSSRPLRPSTQPVSAPSKPATPT